MTPSNLALCLDRAVAHDRASARISDVNGWFEVSDNPISKVGVFDYLGHGLPDAPDAKRTYRVYRPAEELGAQNFVDSMRLIPWINDHRLLGSKLGGTPADQYGISGVVGQDSRFDGEYVRSNIKVYSESMAADLQSGKRELSLGYQCRIDWTPGTFNGQQYDCIQRDLRANHLALVDEGRMGPDVAVLDCGIDRIAIISDFLEHKMSEATNKEPTIADAMKAIATLADSIKQMQEAKAKEDGDEEEEKKAIADKAAKDAEEKATADAAEKAKGTPGAAMDAALKPLRETIEEQAKTIKALQDGQAVAAKTVAMDAGMKNGLYERVKPILGVFDHAGMTYAEMVSYSCDGLKLKPAAGTEAVALDMYLTGHAAAAPSAQAFAVDSKPKAGSVVDRFYTAAKE